ncbi:MAG: dihydrofolate reductase [Crocinitomicaceae bacterium]|nr:dihydrofolate reductase [Crocinitomicaceae bacterium]
MKTSLIVAMDTDRGIGKNNDLMWHLPNDMRFFKETTAGHVVVMGRKNYESIPEKYRPLPNRENVVLTRNESYVADDCNIFHSLEECLNYYKSEEERTIFIIGGGEIYRQALELDAVEEMYISHINHSYGADTFFPEFDLKKWAVESILEQPKDDRHKASFSVMHYTKK